MIVPESVINLNFTLIDESLNLVTLTITWKVSLYIIINIQFILFNSGSIRYV